MLTFRESPNPQSDLSANHENKATTSATIINDAFKTNGYGRFHLAGLCGYERVAHWHHLYQYITSLSGEGPFTSAAQHVGHSDKPVAQRVVLDGPGDKGDGERGGEARRRDIDGCKPSPGAHAIPPNDTHTPVTHVGATRMTTPTRLRARTPAPYLRAPAHTHPNAILPLNMRVHAHIQSTCAIAHAWAHSHSHTTTHTHSRTRAHGKTPTGVPLTHFRFHMRAHANEDTNTRSHIQGDAMSIRAHPELRRNDLVRAAFSFCLVSSCLSLFSLFMFYGRPRTHPHAGRRHRPGAQNGGLK